VLTGDDDMQHTQALAQRRLVIKRTSCDVSRHSSQERKHDQCGAIVLWLTMRFVDAYQINKIIGYHAVRVSVSSRRHIFPGGLRCDAVSICILTTLAKPDGLLLLWRTMTGAAMQFVLMHVL
jgi:hypothetical protein